MNDLNRRNTLTVEQVLKELNEKVLSQQIRIDGLVSTISSLMERLNGLELSVLMMRVNLTGKGPSV